MKNVILITVDCLRADHLSCMGYSKKTTPFIDRIAKENLFFTNAISVAPITRYSFPAILGSIYPNSINLDDPFKKSKSLAEVFKENGYHTAAFHSNIVVSKRFNYHKGFEIFEDNIKLNKKAAKIFRKINKKVNITKIINIFKKIVLSFLSNKIKISGQSINKKAIKWTKNKEKFFLWIHYMDVHGPYVPPKKYIRLITKERFSKTKMANIWLEIIKNIRNAKDMNAEKINTAIELYDSGIRYADDCIKQLIKMLEKQNKIKNTIIIITADHGEEFGEHGGLAHTEKLYNELLHVPLIMIDPEQKNLEETEPVSLLDLAPTILDLADISAPQGYKGVSLLSDKKSPAISEVYNPKEETNKTSIRTKEWKLIYLDKQKKYELYDLKNDQKEQKNVYLQNQKSIEDLKETLNSHIIKSKKTSKDKKMFNDIANIKI